MSKQKEIDQVVADFMANLERLSQLISGAVASPNMAAAPTEPPAFSPYGGSLIVDSIIRQVLRELRSAAEKFPTWPDDALHASAIIGEELGELNQAILKRIYENEGKSPTAQEEVIYQEAIQVVAMGLRFLLGFDLYMYSESDQHDHTGRIIGNE